MFLETQRDPSQTIVLAGSAYSGSNRLCSVLAANPAVRVVAQPFDVRRLAEAANFPRHPYARPGEPREAWVPLIEQALVGQGVARGAGRPLASWWRPQRLVLAARATLLLPWLDRRFHPRIVFVTRHPCAVVLSHLKRGRESYLDDFLAQPQLVADYLGPYLGLIREARTDLQKHTMAWCIENLVPLRQLKDHNWLFCTYEQWCSQPEEEASRVLAGLGLRASWFTRRAIRRLRQAGRPAGTRQHRALDAWQHRLTPQQIDDILALVRAFGIDLYGASAMPRYDTRQAKLVSDPIHLRFLAYHLAPGASVAW